MPVNSRYLDWPGKGPRPALRFTKRPLGALNRVRVTQEYLEIISESDSAGKKARVTQQYLEIISDSGTSKARVSQAYLEIIHTFGTPPESGHGNGVSGNNQGGGKNSPPGQIKKAADMAFGVFLKETRERKRRLLVSNYQPDIFEELFGMPPQTKRPRIVNRERIVEVDAGRHSTKWRN